jgi:hypothetical protein
MRKLIVGLVVVLVLGVGGYLGVLYWAQRIAEREVDAMLAAWGSAPGAATRGRVDLDLWSRTLKVADVAVQSPSGAGRTSMAQVVATGIDRSGRASRIEIVDLEIADALPGAAPGKPAARLAQKAPRVTLVDYAGRPAPPARKPGSALDAMRFWLEQFSAVTASSIEIPSLAVTLTPAAPDGTSGAQPQIEYVYSNVVLRDVRNGKVAEASADGLSLRGSGMGPAAGGITGEVGKLSLTDADMGPLLAFLDPSRPREPGYQRVYGRLSMGPYTARLGDGSSFRIDSMVAEDIGLIPAKLSLDDIVFLTEAMPAAGAVASQAQLVMLMDKLAGLYEGLHLGSLELQGLGVDTKRDATRMASLRIEGLENGRLGLVSIEGLSGRPALGDPFNLGRLAVKGFRIADFMRLVSAELNAPPGVPPGPDRIAAMLALLDGVEIEDVTIPDPKRPMQLGAFKASWGQYVGGLPSQARISLNMTVPIDTPDPEPFINMLAAAGIHSLAVGIDAGASWAEPAQTFALEPGTVEIGGLLAVSAKASVGNVTRDIFSTDPALLMGSAALVQAGPVEVSLRDLGVVDLFAGEVARTAGSPPEQGRAILAEALARKAEALTQTNPEVAPLILAVGRFVQSKGETLTVRLTPKGATPVLLLVEASRSDPVGALLAGFSVEASFGR